MVHYWGRTPIDPRAVAQWCDHRGYMRAMLSTGVRKPTQVLVYVHRVVALGFLGDPGMPLEVVHLNGNKQDNRARNLRWLDAFQAMRCASQLGLRKFVRGAACWNARLNDDEVREIRRRRQSGQTVPAIIDDMRIHRRISARQVYVIARGDVWRHVR
jgi:hypothetical protein